MMMMMMIKMMIKMGIKIGMRVSEDFKKATQNIKYIDPPLPHA